MPEGKENLENRVVAETTLGTEFVDQLFEWNVLMCKSRERRLFDPAQHISEARISRQTGPEYQGICKEAYQSFEFRTVPVCDWRAHNHIFLAAVMGQQNLE